MISFPINSIPFSAHLQCHQNKIIEILFFLQHDTAHTTWENNIKELHAIARANQYNNTSIVGRTVLINAFIPPHILMVVRLFFPHVNLDQGPLQNYLFISLASILLRTHGASGELAPHKSQVENSLLNIYQVENSLLNIYQ